MLLPPRLRPALLACGLALSAVLLAPAANAESAAERGLEIAGEARERDRGFADFTADQTMVLRNKQGQARAGRQLRIKVLEVADDGNKSLFVFDRAAPASREPRC